MREQPDARFTKITDALGDAGKKRQQRTLQRIGADVGNVKLALNLPRQRASVFELQTAMLKRKLNHRLDLRHGAVHRRYPGQRADGQTLTTRPQATQQGFGHDGVADPLGRDDQRTRSGACGVAAGAANLSGRRRNAHPR